MALTGTYKRNLDHKHRLAIPKRLREQFDQQEVKTLFVAPETENSLAIYSPKAFENLADRLANRSSNRAEIRNYLRLFYSRAERVDMDNQGRIRIPERLVEFARLKRDLVLLGVQDHAEIWDAELWDQFLANHRSRFDEMATLAFET